MPKKVWHFPRLDCGGNFLTDPAHLHPEVESVLERNAS